MKKPVSKGILYFSTSNEFSIKGKLDSEYLNQTNIIKDLKDAAECSEFKNVDGTPIEFTFKNELIDTNKKIKKMHFLMKNFNGVNFTDSFKDAPEERQNLFKTWSKFWSHLSKIGYKIK